tara:strand:- start:9496 stop:10086 length:591 start_codon:yes stop_codon:yes gene_type:complete
MKFLFNYSDLISYIIQFLNIKNTDKLLIITKLNKYDIHSSIIHVQNNRKILKTKLTTFHKNSVLKYFKNTFWPMVLLENFVSLNGRSACFMLPKEHTSPIMIGVDFLKRPFVSILYKCYDTIQPYRWVSNEKRYRRYHTIFLEKSQNLWITVGCKTPLYEYIYVDTNDHDEICKNIVRLIKGDKIIRNGYKYDCSL